MNARQRDGELLRDRLQEFALTTADMARVMRHLGDPRSQHGVYLWLHRMIGGQVSVNPTLWPFLELLERMDRAELEQMARTVPGEPAGG